MRRGNKERGGGEVELKSRFDWTRPAGRCFRQRATCGWSCTHWVVTERRGAGVSFLPVAVTTTSRSKRSG
ncbi:hypothetical protein MHYP_G00312180 [Metynnis hypsauchen]